MLTRLTWNIHRRRRRGVRAVPTPAWGESGADAGDGDGDEVEEEANEVATSFRSASIVMPG